MNTSVTANITDIDMFGKVTIIFNCDIITPSNVTLLRSQRALIILVEFSNDNQDEKTITTQKDINNYTTWSVVSFKDNTLVL